MTSTEKRKTDIDLFYYKSENRTNNFGSKGIEEGERESDSLLILCCIPTTLLLMLFWPCKVASRRIGGFLCEQHGIEKL